MPSRKVHVSPVERLVEAYLKRFAKTSNTRGYKQVIHKAIEMIKAVLDNPCCGDNPREVILGRIERNDFVNTLHNLLLGIDARKWRQSLERSVERLERVIGIPCCTETVTFRFFAEDEDFSAATARVAVFLPDGITLVYRTLPLIEGNVGRMVQTTELKQQNYIFCLEWDNIGDSTVPSKVVDDTATLVVTESGPRVASICSASIPLVPGTYEIEVI